MAKSISRKPFYNLAEACERWSLSPTDVAAYALEGELSLSVPAAAVLVKTSDVEHDPNGPGFVIPTGQRRIVGTMDLHRVDAFVILERGGAHVARFFGADGEILEPIDDEGERRVLAVEQASLVVRHAELQRFEAAQFTLPSLDADAVAATESGRRGRGAPPKYDWEGFWCELLVTLNDEGVPVTQTEWTQRMEDWFATQLGPDNVPCLSSIKRRISRVWPRVKPDVGRPSALQSIHGVMPRSPEKGGVPRR